MKLYKLFFMCIFMVLSVFVFAGGTQDATPPLEEATRGPLPVTISALNGPSGIPMAYMFENKPEIENVLCRFEVAASPDILLPKLLKGEVDMAVLPPNVAAKVFTKNNQALLVTAVVGEGNLSLVSKDSSVKSLQDLKGKTVVVAGQGATPDYMFRYLLEKNGIAVSSVAEKGTNTDAVTLDFSIPTAEIPAALIAGKIQYALVPEPFSTVVCSKDPSISRVIDIQKEYASIDGNDSNFPLTVLVVRKSFAVQYPEVVREITAAFEDSITWTEANPIEAGKLVEKYTLGLQGAIAAKVIPVGAFVFTPASEAKESLESLYNVFMTFSPEAIGGSLPTSDFYFE